MSRSLQPSDANRGERLANWLALLALLAAGIVWAPADAAAPMLPEEHAAGLFLKASADAAPVEALRQATRVHALVTGNTARIHVIQSFSNTSTTWMEGLYVFPLPSDAAVDELTLHVGERTIRGQIRERQQAQDEYQQARNAGRQASLLGQQRPVRCTGRQSSRRAPLCSSVLRASAPRIASTSSVSATMRRRCSAPRCR